MISPKKKDAVTICSLSIFVLFTAPLNLYASDVYEVEISASGVTKQEAIYEGLIEAIRQVNGVEISSETKSSFSYKELNISNSNSSEDISSGKSALDKDINSKTKGLVKGYQIVSAEENISGWSAFGVYSFDFGLFEFLLGYREIKIEAKEFMSNKTNSKFSKNYVVKGGQPQFGFGIKF